MTDIADNPLAYTFDTDEQEGGPLAPALKVLNNLRLEATTVLENLDDGRSLDRDYLNRVIGRLQPHIELLLKSYGTFYTDLFRTLIEMSDEDLIAYLETLDDVFETAIAAFSLVEQVMGLSDSFEKLKPAAMRLAMRMQAPVEAFETVSEHCNKEIGAEVEQAFEAGFIETVLK